MCIWDLAVVQDLVGFWISGPSFLILHIGEEKENQDYLYSPALCLSYCLELLGDLACTWLEY